MAGPHPCHRRQEDTKMAESATAKGSWAIRRTRQRESPDDNTSGLPQDQFLMRTRLSTENTIYRPDKPPLSTYFSCYFRAYGLSIYAYDWSLWNK